MKTMFRFFGVLIVAVLALTARTEPAATTASAAAENPRERVQIGVRLLGTRSLEGRLGGTELMGSASGGPDSLIYGATGSFDESGAITDGLCMHGSGSGPTGRDALVRQWTAESPHVWWAGFELLERGVDEITLQVTWEYLFSERPGLPVVVRGDTRIVTLEEGQRHVLDFLAAESDEASICPRNVMVEISAEVVEAPALAQRMLRYDLWLAHDASGNRSQSRHLQAAGLQGEEVEFRFEPLRFDVPGQELAGHPLETIVSVSGVVRGRLRPDGSIDLVLDASRKIDLEKSGEQPSGGIGDGGRKKFSVRPGETVRLELPPAAGHVWMSETTKSLGQGDGGKTAPPGSARVQLSELFASDVESLTLTVTPVH